MKIRISGDGYLHLMRGAQWRQQFCPFATHIEGLDDCRCGDWCPLFGEPLNRYYDSDEVKTLELCQGRTLRALKTDFTDERGDE